MVVKRLNGSLWKIISVVITLAVVGGSIIFGYATLGHNVGDNCDDIAEMKPIVQLNSEHRIQDEVDTRYIKEKISNIETVQRQILDEVRK
jgi:hypothetical protein